MKTSVAEAMKGQALAVQRNINLARQLFALQIPGPICLLGPDCPCQVEHAQQVDAGYRDLLVVEFGGWHS